MHVTQPLLLRQFFAMELGRVKILAMLDQFGAQCAHGLDLPRIAVLRHHQGASDAELPRRVSQRLPVIAGSATDNAPLLLICRQAAQQVDAAAHLERPGRLVVLVLQQVTESQPLFQQRPFVQQSGAQVPVYLFAGLYYVFIINVEHVQEQLVCTRMLYGL